MTHSSSFWGCIKPIGLCAFKDAFCDLEACSSARAVLRASRCARVLSLMSFWSARISSISCRRFAISFFSSSYASAGGKDLIWWNVTKARIIRLLASIAESDSRTRCQLGQANDISVFGSRRNYLLECHCRVSVGLEAPSPGLKAIIYRHFKKSKWSEEG